MVKRYVDGYVLPVPQGKMKEYQKMAAEAGKMWMKHGALAYYECEGDDLTPDRGVKMAQFPKLTRAKEDETIIFAFVIYRSRSHRDKVNAKVMKDPAMSDPALKDMPMPFEVKRMAYGGFSSIVGYEQ